VAVIYRRAQLICLYIKIWALPRLVETGAVLSVHTAQALATARAEALIRPVSTVITNADVGSSVRFYQTYRASIKLSTQAFKLTNKTSFQKLLTCSSFSYFYWQNNCIINGLLKNNLAALS
jgi:hypothetical protein